MDLSTWTSIPATVAMFNARIRDNFTAIGVTSTYTPTIAGTGWAKGNGTLTGYYTDFGNKVELAIKFILGTTSTGGTGGITFTVPVGTVATGRAVGVVQFIKGGGAFAGICDVGGSSTSTVTPYVISSAAGQLGFVVNGAPSAGNWTTSDSMYLAITYYR